MKTTIVLLSTILLHVAGLCQGTLVYDQQASIITQLGGSFIQNQQPMGQSFTPSLSAVGFVQFQFFDTTGSQGSTVYVKLHENSITGNVIAVTAPVSMQNGFIGLTNFFFPMNVSVQAGQKYFFVPVLQSGDNTALMSGRLNYADGEAYFSGIPSSSEVDFWFREGIVVPEPTTSSIFLIGVVGLVVFTRKQKA